MSAGWAAIKRKFAWDTSDLGTDIYARNEITANRIVSSVLLICVAVNAIAAILTALELIRYDYVSNAYLFLGFVAFIFLIPSLYCRIRKGRGGHIKYILMISLTLAIYLLCYLLPSYSLILLLIPLVMAGCYYSLKFALISAVITTVMFLVNSIFLGDTLVNQVHYLPLDIGCLLVLVTICMLTAIRGKRMVAEQALNIQETSRIDSELALAADIQTHMLPTAVSAEKVPEEFAVCGSMAAAKKVGGDFYDYFMIDDDHVALVIADVSGKGIPAALFMVTARTLIKTQAQLGLSPAEVMTRVNKLLCEGNDAGLFVTAWFGIFSYRTGKLTYVNAGHNSPFYHKAGADSFVCLRNRSGLVLAGMETTRYRQSEIFLSPGDRFYLYTDGVTEATDRNNELYGEDRLVAYINAHCHLSPPEFLAGIKEDIDAYVGDVEQFDDITMLVMDYLKKPEDSLIERVFPADIDSFGTANAFVEDEMAKAEVPMNIAMQVLTAFEEIFVNVARYAYPNRLGNVTVAVSIIENTIAVTLKDSGIPFDPLSKEDPDITLSAEDREIGGLGILMVKKIMDDVTYAYRNGMNVLTMIKSY